MLSLEFIDRKISMYVSVVSKIALIFTNVRINGDFYQIKVFFFKYISYARYNVIKNNMFHDLKRASHID